MPFQRTSQNVKLLLTVPRLPQSLLLNHYCVHILMLFSVDERGTEIGELAQRDDSMVREERMRSVGVFPVGDQCCGFPFAL